MTAGSGPIRGAGVQHRAASEVAVVTAACATAADIGAQVLRDGGNVYDAALATAFAETVLLPPKCGLAGDLVGLVVRPGEAGPEALVAVGPAGRNLATEVASQPLPATGGLSVGIPGAPAGYAALHERATRSLAELAAPAIALARDGFPWPEVSAWLTTESARVLTEENPGGVVYLPGGSPAPPGAHTVLPGLAEVLEQFVERGAALFDGPVGDAVLAAVRGRGGVLERDELSAARAEWGPAARSAAEPAIWATPAPTHGPSLLDAIDDLRGCVSPAQLVARVEAAVDRRRRRFGDSGSGGGTSVVTVADSAGHAVVLVHSNSFQRYGSGIIVEPYGLVLSNRPGRGFTTEPGHPNFPLPGRRPVLTLHAWAAGLDDGSLLLGATPGGENQMRWNAQTIAGVRAGTTDPGELVRAPRWARFAGRLAVEGGFDRREIAALALSEAVDEMPVHALRSAQQVLHVRRRDGRVVAGADPRTAAAARGL